MMLTHQMLSAYSRLVRSNGVKYDQRGSNDHRTDVVLGITSEVNLDGQKARFTHDRPFETLSDQI